MADEKIIRFPSGETVKTAKVDAVRKPAREPVQLGAKTDAATPPDGLTPEQRKAIGIILSGMPFVAIGIKPTPSGADFFTAIGGDGADLRNASTHLPGVIERALGKRGI